MNRFEVVQSVVYAIKDNEKDSLYTVILDYPMVFESASEAKKEADFMNTLYKNAQELVKNNYSWLRGRHWSRRKV